MDADQAVELDLQKCFNGEQQLVTWDIAYRALCDPATASKSTSLRAFLSAKENIAILSSPWKPFPEPSTQENTKFESKTAPISVAPSTAGSYDINEIKEDSLWLSKEARISQYAALQLVVHEWQGRSSTQLLSGLTEEEALSVQEAAGLKNLGASTFIPGSSILTTPLPSRHAQFESEDQRRLRLIDLYHSSCASILRISQLLISWSCASHLRSQTIYDANYMTFGAGWIEELGKTIQSSQAHKASAAGTPKALDECLEAVKTKCTSLETGYTWNVGEAILDAASERWIVAQTTELLHLLHLTFVHADLVVTGFLPAAAVQSWLSFFLSCNFFREFPTISSGQEPIIPVIQLLTSLVALSILKMDLVIGDLDSGDYMNWDPTSYVLDAAAIETITEIFGETKLLGPSPATPPTFAWALIIWKLTNRAQYEDDERERLIEAGTDHQAPPPVASALSESALAVARLETHELFDSKFPYEDLATASSNFGVLAIVNQMTDIGTSSFGTLVDRMSQDRTRLSFLSLIRAALGSEIVEYSPDLIVTTYAILAGDKTFQNWVDSDYSRQTDPVVAFFLEDDQVLRPLILDEARLRYPYEMAPFLKFCSVLTRGDQSTQNGMPAFVDKLANSNRLMQRLPDSFRAYALTREDENANWVQLTADLPLFSSRSKGLLRGHQRLLNNGAADSADNFMAIPAGTEGIIVDESVQPYVAVWNFQHSTLSYLVELLSTYSVESNKVEFHTNEPAPRDTIVEIIGLFSDLMHSSLRSSDNICSSELLEALGIQNTNSHDTVTILLSIFDEELLRLSQEPNNEASLALLVNCTHFLEAYMMIAPHRVWSWLARSRLLEADGSGSLATILMGTEMVLGRYDFLIGCIRIYKGLVKDSVDRYVSRTAPTKAVSRFTAPAPIESGTSDKTMSIILFTFGRTLANIYESSLSWRYSCPEHRSEINLTISEIFTTILHLAYGVDDAHELSAKVTRSIAPIAEYIAQLYLTKSGSDLPTNPVLVSMVLGAGSEDKALLTNNTTRNKHQTKATLAFAEILVRVATLQQRPWTQLEQQLFKATPLLARLYATSDMWKSKVLVLLEALVRGAVRGLQFEEITADENRPNGSDKKDPDQKQEPPSLLGHLGPRTAKNFLDVLSKVDEPLRIVDIQTNVWNLLSAVVTCKQQWFSLYLLTGSTPRDSLRNKPDGANRSKDRALLTRALHALSTVPLSETGSPSQPWPLYISMLDFVSSSQNNWSWALGSLQQRKEVVQNLLAFLKWMTKQPRQCRTEAQTLERSYQNRFASLACGVIAMYLHSARQIGDVTVLKQVVPDLTNLEEIVLELPSYNTSLHDHLKQNLERQYRGVLLSNLKKTTLYPGCVGRSFFYDIELAQRLLGFDSQWAGPREGTGFAAEVGKANLNIGLVESQVQLLQSWRLLALELGYVVDKDHSLVPVLIGTIRKCMEANAQSSLPEAFFGQLMDLRADLAFALLKKLVEANIRTPETRLLLSPVWRAICVSSTDLDNIYSGSDVTYYRSLLRILYLTLDFHMVDDSDESEEVLHRSSFRGTMPASRSSYAEPVSTLLLEILSVAVAKGFRSLATQLHADPSTVSPADFALLTALLQRVIAIPEMAKWQTQAALCFSDNTTIRYATSLYSWSDRLTINHNGVKDPIYGELSVLFLLSLSSIQPLAETMAVEGVLSQLNTANIMNYYRRQHGMGPFDSPSRLYSIWTKGILPLCLNLLLSIGAPIAAEVVSFLNQFPEQLHRASVSLNASPTSRGSTTRITLSMAAETHSLAMVSTILEAVRKQGPKLGIQVNEVATLDWDKESVKEDLESWLSRKATLQERIVASDERENNMMSKKKDSDAGWNEFEARVLAELENARRCLEKGN